MRLPPEAARSRFADARRAILATVRPDGSPHLIPIVFALVGEAVYSAVDDKPKSSTRLQRLANLRHEPRCSLVVDHYDDEWSQLWWVRIDGRAEILDEVDVDAQGRDALTARYEAYRSRAPVGPYLRIRVLRLSGWEAS